MSLKGDHASREQNEFAVRLLLRLIFQYFTILSDLMAAEMC